MADEQYEWLDKDAAEKLLRREPVDPADGRTRQEAERLAAALDEAARSALPATRELPGEAAALAAFRAVPRPASRTAAARSVVAADDSAEAEVLAPVHIGRAASGAGPAGSRGARPIRWSRPLRFGLVASLACCAIGGVAVAAGSGMLPGPFGRHTPAPATSVSAAASPQELGSGLTTDDETSAPPPGAPDPGTPSPNAPDPGATTGAETERPGPTGPTGQSGRTDGERGSTGEDRSGGATTGPADGTGDKGGEDRSGDGGDNGSGAWYAKTLKACRDYRDGKLDDDRRRRLEALAKGARNLDRFCDRILGTDDDRGGDEQGGEGNSGPGGGDASGSLPAARFTVSPQPSVAGLVPGPGAGDSTPSLAPEPAVSGAAR
ncbi:hypothetical protein [Streptomyces sp. ITFR-16]|uniref:hypothetical protein n=1 Tax=Streptomyces sp. ITFR-16 TaxID=3075198 RepID=UPI00288C2AA6|nr:hypothetical protein [Streptomyces sp. ITFR-16]WNI22890.1 hypothetical protein RLT58_13565 [Streptomyces sp. ITFR-16]